MAAAAAVVRDRLPKAMAGFAARSDSMNRHGLVALERCLFLKLMRRPHCGDKVSACAGAPTLFFGGIAGAKVRANSEVNGRLRSAKPRGPRR